MRRSRRSAGPCDGWRGRASSSIRPAMRGWRHPISTRCLPAPSLQRPCQPAELATAYVMLADPLSSYVSGATIAVAGGKPII